MLSPFVVQTQPRFREKHESCPLNAGMSLPLLCRYNLLFAINYDKVGLLQSAYITLAYVVCRRYNDACSSGYSFSDSIDRFNSSSITAVRKECGLVRGDFWWCGATIWKAEGSRHGSSIAKNYDCIRCVIFCFSNCCNIL